MNLPCNNSSETTVLEDSPDANPFVGEALLLTKELVHRFWNGEVAWCVDRLAEDFLWIGAQEDQSVVSRDEFRCQMEEITRERPRVVLAGERYVPVAAAAELCVTAGSYLGFSVLRPGKCLRRSSALRSYGTLEGLRRRFAITTCPTPFRSLGKRSVRGASERGAPGRS